MLSRAETEFQSTALVSPRLLCLHFSSDLYESQDRVQDHLGEVAAPFAFPHGDASDKDI